MDKNSTMFLNSTNMEHTDKWTTKQYLDYWCNNEDPKTLINTLPTLSISRFDKVDQNSLTPPRRSVECMTDSGNFQQEVMSSSSDWSGSAVGGNESRDESNWSKYSSAVTSAYKKSLTNSKSNESCKSTNLPEICASYSVLSSTNNSNNDNKTSSKLKKEVLLQISKCGESKNTDRFNIEVLRYFQYTLMDIIETGGSALVISLCLDKAGACYLQQLCEECVVRSELQSMPTIKLDGSRCGDSFSDADSTNDYRPHSLDSISPKNKEEKKEESSSPVSGMCLSDDTRTKSDNTYEKAIPQMSLKEQVHTLHLMLQYLAPYVKMLCTHKYGNYVIQKVLDVTCGNSENLQLKKMGDEFAITSMLTHFSTLCRDKYGFRTLQRLIHMSDSAAVRQMLVEQLCSSDQVMNACSCNPYGNLVVQKLIQKLPREWLGVISKALSGKICDYCVDPYGSHVVQMMMECYSNDNDRMTIYKELLSKIVGLSQHMRGNYVVQKMVTICQSPPILQQICSVLCEHIGTLCLNKISSNVIQLALRSLPLDFRNLIIDSIYNSKATLTHTHSNYHHYGHSKRQDLPLAAQLITHKYGNYVVQTVLEVCSQEKHESMVMLVRPHISEGDLPRFPWGKKLRKKLHTYDQTCKKSSSEKSSHCDNASLHSVASQSSDHA